MATELQDFTRGLVNLLINPEKDKVDIAAYMSDQARESENLSELLGDAVNDSLVEDVGYANTSLTSRELDVIYKAQRNVDGMIELYDVEKQTTELQKSVVALPSKEEARFFVDCFYQIQNMRIRLQNQMRSIIQEKDNNQPETVEEKGKKKKKTKILSENTTFIGYILRSMRTIEDSIKCGLEEFSNSTYIGRWSKEVTGIGPVISTCLMAGIDLKDNFDGHDTFMKAANIWSYCGLNDNNRPWLGRDKIKKILEDLIKENNGKLDDSVVMRLSGITKWRYSEFEENAKSAKGKWNKDKVIKIASKVPYNQSLKVLMFKIGDQFIKNCNRGSFYGELFKKRRDLEIMHNENGDYAEQAAQKLKDYNITKPETKKCYEAGKLPPGHILSRSRRYAVKLFMSHYYEAMYYNKYGKMPPIPYILEFGDHHDYIGPEVPYDMFERDPEFVKINPTDPNVFIPSARKYTHLEFDENGNAIYPKEA